MSCSSSRYQAKLGLLLALLLVPSGVTACAERTEDMNLHRDTSRNESTVDTQRTSREIFDEFMAATDAAIKATGVPDGWTFVNDAPWAVDYEEPILSGPCRVEEYETGPRRLGQQVFGPVPDDPEQARNQMRTYFESQGMTITAAFDRKPDEPPHATWTVTAEGQDGASIKFSANTIHRALQVTSECSSHPSLQEPVSPTVR